MKNSKKGFGLVTTIVISVVLFILTAGLITAAVLSLQLTAKDIDQRQAYINAKSALGVMEAYYLQQDKLPVVDEYFAFDAQNGTFENGMVKVDLPGTDNKKTYVKASYDMGAQTLKLLAVARYMSPTLDNTQNLQLSCRYDVGYDADSRITTVVRKVTSQDSSRYVTVHVKPYPGSMLSPYLYTWAYGDGMQDQTPNDAINQAAPNDIKLSGDWGVGYSDPNLNGPQGAMYEEGNGWYYYTVEITDPNINYFNAIVTKKGAARDMGGGNLSRDAQTHEMFNLPVPETLGESQDVYITLNNKNRDFTDFVNFELNGKILPNSLTQYLTSYVKADYTTLHVRMQGTVTDSWTDAPQVTVLNEDGSALTDKNLTTFMDTVETAFPGGTLQYEGYGWYKINVPTRNDFLFTLTGTVGGKAIRVRSDAVNGGNNNEIWVALNKSGVASVKKDEADANRAFKTWGDITAGDYTTVNVKGLALKETAAGGAAQVNMNYYLVTNSTENPPSQTGDTKITLNYQDDTTESEVILKNAGDTLELPNAPQRAGFVFKGWASGAQDKEAQYAPGADYIVPDVEAGASGKQIFLYGIWHETDYIIQYNANGGGTAPATQSVLTAYPVTISGISQMRRVGYTFKGWSLEKDGPVQYNGGEEVTVADIDGLHRGKALVLYAVWQKNENKYVLSYDLNGGSGKLPEFAEADPGETLLVGKGDVYRSGYIFLGWSKSKSAQTETYIAGSEITLTKDITLYAVWKSEQFTITYHANGGENAPAQQSGAMNALVTISAAVPVKSGFLFAGWAKEDPNAQTAGYQPGDTVRLTGNITLYAVWQKETAVYLCAPTGDSNNNGWNNAPRVHMWGTKAGSANTPLTGDWNAQSPGGAMTRVAVQGTYTVWKFTVPAGYTGYGVIFRKDAGTRYHNDDKTFGAGESKIFFTENSSFEDLKTVSLQNNLTQKWSSVYAHSFTSNNTGNQSKWPGELLTNADGGKDVYTYFVNGSLNRTDVMFHPNQTGVESASVDISKSSTSINKVYRFTGGRNSSNQYILIVDEQAAVPVSARGSVQTSGLLYNNASGSTAGMLSADMQQSALTGSGNPFMRLVSRMMQFFTGNGIAIDRQNSAQKTALVQTEDFSSMEVTGDVNSALSISPLASISGGTTLYLKPNSNWKADSARFAAYCFTGQNNGQWVSMTAVPGEDGLYQAKVPTGTWSNVIFCRMNGSSNRLNVSQVLVTSSDPGLDGNTTRIYIGIENSIVQDKGDAWKTPQVYCRENSLAGTERVSSQNVYTETERFAINGGERDFYIASADIPKDKTYIYLGAGGITLTQAAFAGVQENHLYLLYIENGVYKLIDSGAYVPAGENNGFTGTWTKENQSMASNRGDKVQYYNVYMEKYKDENNQIKNKSYSSYGYHRTRAGNSKTCYYDEWYSYKIPTTGSYTVAFEGLYGGNSKETVPVKNMTGDIWITLDTDKEESGKLSDLSVYTFDPEKNYAQGTTNVYFKDTEGWADKNGGIYAYSWGTETTQWPGVKMQYDSEVGLYYAQLKSSTPFVIFNDGTADKGAAKKTRVLSQQGTEGKILFDNDSTKKGEWENYIHPKTELEKARQDAVAALNRSAVYGVDANGDQSTEKKYFVMLQSKIKEAQDLLGASATAAQCTAAAKTLNDYVTAVNSFSEVVREARIYLSGYKEYDLYHTDDITFTADSLKTLKDAHKEIMQVYEDYNVPYTKIATGALTLRKVIDNMEQVLTNNTSGTGTPVTSQAVVVLMDKANWMINSSIPCRIEGVTYKDGNPITSVSSFNEQLTYVNSQGYYLYYIDFAGNQNTAKNVKFIVNVNKSVPLDGIKAGETWVYDNEKGKWKKNSRDDNYMINTPTISGRQNDKKIYQSKTGGNFKMTFLYDTTVSYAGASYVVYAGVYDISVADYPSGINLFSSKAKSFFTKQENFGMDAAGLASADSTVGWTADSGKLQSGPSAASVSGTVNFLVGGKLGIYKEGASLSNESQTAADLNAVGAKHSITGNNGTFPASASYEATKINFRWVQNGVTGDIPDLTDKHVALRANNITFACTDLSVYETGIGTLRGSFIIGNATAGTDFNNTVRFYTDVKVNVLKSDGSLDTQKSFTINNGLYKLQGEIDLFSFNKELEKTTGSKIQSLDSNKFTGGTYGHD